MTDNQWNEYQNILWLYSINSAPTLMSMKLSQKLTVYSEKNKNNIKK